MARRHWVKINGRKVYGPTLAQVHEYAVRMGRKLGKVLQVGYDQPRTTTLRRNPDPGSYLPVFHEQIRAREARKQYADATKPRRLAKGDRRPGVTPAPAAKARYAIDVRNRRESYTLSAATKAAANALGAQYEAAGYNVSIRAL